ncbi:AI-2E family transporter [Amorphus orientalis]|uniref:PurR-regulated permease PerM n=1 Tax=Amorphus orientalis TaxID=649198 RepID=A0AAE3VP64_9HYPH|nr:AI-2E family transporter [Amorphus orientalis]MDQ0315724.1 putative PurR-regulated permease PerM [Amorphus orientalis]
MTLGRQIIFWVVAAVAFLLLLRLFQGILLPFVAGLFLAYLLNPVARWLERHGLNRVLATSLILIVFVVFVILALVVVVPLIANQLIGFLERVPGYISQLQAFLNEHAQTNRIADVLGVDTSELQSAATNLVSQGSSWAGSVVKSVWSGSQAVISVLSLVVITPVIAFYLLIDWERMMRSLDDLLPREHAETIRGLLGDMDRAVSGFIHGQVSVCLLLGLFYAVALVAVGLNHGLTIGLMAGLISFVPYLGSGLGFVVSVGVALNQFWPDSLMIGLVVAIFLVGQFFEGNVLQPKLVGGRVGLHPVWLIFALFAFGYLFGFAGMLIAVPASAAVAVLVRFFLQRYRESRIYQGHEGGSPPEPVPSPPPQVPDGSGARPKGSA